MPQVSIIVPAYNSAHLIESTLRSILNSTTKDYEVIIVNDGSTDNLDQVVKPFIDSCQFKYIKQDNKGLAAARNTGIKKR